MPQTFQKRYKPTGKQHRIGYKKTNRLANLEAISQSIQEESRILCLGCEAEITSTDFEVGECTQCHRLFSYLEKMEMLLIFLEKLKEH